jgi:hypothetical protein
MMVERGMIMIQHRPLMSEATMGRGEIIISISMRIAQPGCG